MYNFSSSLLLLLLLLSEWGVSWKWQQHEKLSRVKLYSYMIVIIFLVLFLILLKAKKSFLHCEGGWVLVHLLSLCVPWTCLNVLSLLIIISLMIFTSNHIRQYQQQRLEQLHKTLNEWITLFLLSFVQFFSCVCVCAVVVPSSFIKIEVKKPHAIL